MAYIKQVDVVANNNNTSYLIEPTLFSAATTSNGNYSASFNSNFELINGVCVQVKFPSTNADGAKLNNKNIFYNNTAITAGTIKANHTYALVYDGVQWQLVGDIDTDTTYTNGTGLNLSGNTFSVAYGTTAGTAAQGNDSRLSDARTPLSHTHGNITNDGKVGTGNTLLKTVSGEIQAGPALSTAISAQDTSTKFLREDGTWSAPSYPPGTDVKVTQSGTVENKNFPILLKHTNNFTNETDGVNFVDDTNDKAVTINPSTGAITAPGGIIGNSSSASSVPWSGVTGADDLAEIESLTGTSGLLRKTGTNTWTLDTNAYVTSSGVTSITIKTDSPLTGGDNTATTSTGTYTIGFSPQLKNLVLASDDSSNNQVPTFRTLVNDDLPVIDIYKGGTGITSYVVGDILYASATDTLTRLAGNTSSTRQFLYSSSRQNVASQPAWTALEASDIPELSWSKITSGLPTTLSGYGITDAYISNGTITLGSNSITPLTSVTLADLGLTKPLQFRGTTTTTMSDGYTGIPAGIATNYVPTVGDVVIDSSKDSEYVCISVSGTTYTWERLGRDGSWALSDHVHGNITNDGKIGTGDTLIKTVSGVVQAGPTLSSTVTTQTQSTKFLREDGSWAVPSYTINAANVTGIVSVEHGGTGVNGTNDTNDAFGKNQVLITNNPSSGGVTKFLTKAYCNSSSAEAIGTSENFVTERDIYYGLPTINNDHTYKSNTALFAPTTSGTKDQILISGGTNIAPVWSETASLKCEYSVVANEAKETVLTLGNNANITSTTQHSEGKLFLYSAATHGHILSGKNTGSNTDNFTHVLQNANGYLLQSTNEGTVGSATRPIYIAANGIATALSFTANRLYYSASTTSFEATNHYASTTSVFINKIPGENETISDNLYVSGSTRFNGTVYFQTSDTNANKYYIDTSAIGSLSRLNLGGTVNTNYYLYVHGSSFFNSTTYFGSTSYYINASGEGQLSQLTVDQINLDSDTITFNPATGSGTYGSIAATQNDISFSLTSTSASGFCFNKHIYPDDSNKYTLGTSSYKWSDVYATNFHGALDGNASTATQWASAQTVYVNLSNASTSTSIQGNSNAVALGIDGTLTVAHGGTGVTSFTANCVIMSGAADSGKTTSTANLVTRAVSDSSSASALSSSSTNLVTEEDVYFGLPTINNSHNYTSNTSIFAPTDKGTANQILLSGGNNNVPIWTSYLEVSQGGTGRTTITNHGVAVGGDSSLNYITPNTTAGLPLITQTLNNAAIDPAWYGGVTFTGTSTSNYVAHFKGTTNASNITSGAVQIDGGLGVNSYIYADRVYNAVWNDYAEFRESPETKPGICVQENDNGCLTKTNKRLIPGACIITDTFGYAEGESDKAKTPVAVAGRVLAYTYQSREKYHAGMAVCSAPNGTIDIMTHKEIRNHPDAIIGIVSEIPTYEVWGSGNIKVDNRIWIKVK